MAAVFCGDSKESVVITTILVGLHSQERSRLVLFDRPRSYGDFDNMWVYAHKVQISEDRNVASPSCATPVPRDSGVVRACTGSHNQMRRTVVCFHCNSPGHIRQ
jgi:hypothetical protein